ncbi:DoxX family membrane protein [Streptomyces sp. NPDC047043]|uniref:DoxX family membrane protein n=1 Tax=Streptomyces sp. NPDC047043 TaxID=3154497 RepID=UPI0033DA17C5
MASDPGASGPGPGEQPLSRAATWAVRAAVSAVFVSSGTKVLRDPEGPTAGAAGFLHQVKKAVPAISTVEDRDLVRLNAAVQFGAGVGLAVGGLPRLCAAVLAASVVPTTLAAYPFWRLPGGPERSRAHSEFLKNLALAGGLIGLVVRPRHDAARGGPDSCR